jgi:hypothetical protein
MLKTIIIAACVCFAAFTGYRIYEKRDAVVPVTIPIVARPDVVPPVVIPKPAPVREQAPPKKKTERERDPVREHVKPKPTHVEVIRGTLKPAYSCATLKGYVDKYGKTLVRNSAPAYGFSLEEVDAALKVCGI